MKASTPTLDSQQRAGSVSLTWIAEPTKAGWWWWESYSDPVFVIERNGKLYFRHPIPMSADELLQPCAFGGRWAGPLERPSEAGQKDA